MSPNNSIRAPLRIIDSRRANPSVKKCRDSVIGLPLDYKIPSVRPAPSVAVLLHAHYTDDLAEFQKALRNIPFPFALFISTDTEQKKTIIEQNFTGWAAQPFEVHVFPNRGRDIAPKFVGFRAVYEHYAFVLHLHTKRSSHTAALKEWRSFLLNCLLGSSEIVASIFEMFSQCPQLGMVAPRSFEFVRKYMVWGGNFATCAKLAAGMGIRLKPNSPLDFAAGSMFWARTAALEPLLRLDLAFDSFDEELGQIDGALCHAIERLTFYSCEKAGYTWLHAGPLGHPAPFEKPVRVSSS